jgi:probable HAF family extracellular repeat protein
MPVKCRPTKAEEPEFGRISMRQRRKLRSLALSLACIGGVPCGAASAASLGPGDIRVLEGVAGVQDSVATDINNAGVVIGEAHRNNEDWHPFLDPGFSNQPFESLPSGIALYPNGNFSAIAKNGRTVVGQTSASIAWVRPGAPGSSVFYPGTLGGNASGAFGVNAGGAVVGGALTPSGAVHGFLHPGTPGGSMVDLGTLPGALTSDAQDINDAGLIVGNSGNQPYVIPPGGTMRGLGTLPGGMPTVALAVNESGTIVGYGHTTFGAGNLTHRQPFRHNGGPTDTYQFLQLTPAAASGLTFSTAYDINDFGYVVGTDTYKAVLWRPDNSVVDLDLWLHLNNPTEAAMWTLTSAYGINNSGQIVGVGTYNDGPGGLTDGTRGFILDASSLAVPEPGGLALVGIAGLMMSARRRRKV